MTQSPVPGQHFLPVRNRATVVFDSIGRSFCFGQATKYGHMTKIEAQGARRLIDRSGEAAAGNANYKRTGDPRFEIDKAARNDKRNCV
jgi:hypothetical protein